jgi:hypothetical protein
MNWQDLEGLQAVDLAQIGTLEPIEVLYQFELPCIFTAKTPSGLLLLAYFAAELEEEARLRFIVSTTSPRTIDDLKVGAITMREAILRGSLWLVDLDGDDLTPKRAFMIEGDQLPADTLPEAGTMLLPALEPDLRIKLCGESIVFDALPAVVLGQAAEIAKTALKPLVEHLAKDLRADMQGRPPEWLRELYTLQVQHLAPGSLDVFFRLPKPVPLEQQSLPLNAETDFDAEGLRARAWELLKQGLDWTMCDTEDIAPLGEAAPAILESLRRLAPMSSTKGPVTSVEVSGVMLGQPVPAFRLTQQTTARIRSTLTRISQHQEAHLGVFEGRIRSLDLDLLRFILRNPAVGAGEVQFLLDDDCFFEDAKDAYYQELPVKIAGRSTDGKIWAVLDLEFSGNG